MTLQTTQYDNIHIVQLPEKLTMANAAETKESLITLIQEGSTRVILDLSQMSFADSSGLSVLVAAYKALEEKSGKAVLLSPRPNVLALLELTRMHEIFELFTDQSAALKHVAA